MVPKQVEAQRAQLRARAGEAAGPDQARAELDAQLQAARAEAARGEGLVRELQGRLADARSEKAAAAEELAALQEGTLALEARLAYKEHALAGVRGELAGARAELAAEREAAGKVAARHGEAAARVAELQRDMAAHVVGAICQIWLFIHLPEGLCHKVTVPRHLLSSTHLWRLKCAVCYWVLGAQARLHAASSATPRTSFAGA